MIMMDEIFFTHFRPVGCLIRRKYLMNVTSVIMSCVFCVIMRPHRSLKQKFRHL